MRADVQDILSRYGAQVEARLAAAVPRRGGDVLSEAAWHHLDGGGKRLRSALCLAACEALGGRAEQALDFAVAVELLHNMLLVHDDLEDRDRFRRDRPAVWVRYGEANAINVGDWLFALACRSALRTPAPDAVRLALVEDFIGAYEKTVEGQALDLDRRGAPDFTVEQYVELATLKTGHYLALGLVGGARIAGADERMIATLRAFGRHAGPAFQVRDDVIDLTAGKGRNGRTGCDIEEGKPSALYAWALAHAAPDDRTRLIAIMRAPREATPAEDVRWAMALYERTGATAFAGRFADELMAKARAALAVLPGAGGEALQRLADYLTERTT